MSNWTSRGVLRGTAAGEHVAGDLEGPGENRTWARPELLAEKAGPGWTGKAGVGGRQRAALCGGHPQATASSLPPRPASRPAGALRPRRLSFPRGTDCPGTWESWSEACAVVTAWASPESGVSPARPKQTQARGQRVQGAAHGQGRNR